MRVLGALLALSTTEAIAGEYRIGGEVGFFHDGFEGFEGSVTTFTEVVDADLTFGDSVSLVAALPFTQIIGAGGGETEARFHLGNPSVLAYYRLELFDGFALRIGGGAAIPLARIPNDFVDGTIAFASYAVATAMYGQTRPWLWFPEVLPIVIPSVDLGVDLGFLEIFGGAHIVLVVKTSDDVLNDSLEVIIPVGGGALAHVGPVGLGGRIDAVFTPTVDDGDDGFQSSLSPMVTLTLADILELEARLTMNLDDPAGFAFESGGVWGFFLGAHAVF